MLGCENRQYITFVLISGSIITKAISKQQTNLQLAVSNFITFELLQEMTNSFFSKVLQYILPQRTVTGDAPQVTTIQNLSRLLLITLTAQYLKMD